MPNVGSIVKKTHPELTNESSKITQTHGFVLSTQVNNWCSEKMSKLQTHLQNVGSIQRVQCVANSNRLAIHISATYLDR
jgi:hypothetical protein